MKLERLHEIKKRAEEATEGPWSDENGIVTADKLLDRKYGEPEEVAETTQSDADAEFIANARQDIPDLIAEVERLRTKLMTIHLVAEQEITYGTKVPAKDLRDYTEEVLNNDGSTEA